MALQLEKELDNEVIGDYWKIDKLEIQFDKNPFTVVWLALYKSQAARNRNKEPIFTQIFRYGETLNTRNEVYTKIKAPILVKVIDTPEIKDFITGVISQEEVSHMEETNPFVNALDV